MVVDACLGGVRIARPAGATLDLNFMSAPLDPRITFTRASTATYTDASGVIQTAAVNAPRWDYANGLLRGVLKEEARINLLLQSNVGVGPWAAVNVSSSNPVATANNVAAPDGTTTATRIVYPALTVAGTASFWYQQLTTVAQPYAFSVWLRGSVGGEQTYLEVTVGGTFLSSPRLTLTTQWQRFSFVTTALTASVWAFAIGTDLRDVTQTSTLAQTVYAWGAQVEQATSTTSYIPTTTAAVTRAFDDCYIPSVNMTPWFASPGGSWLAEFIDNTPTGSTNPRVVGIHDGTGITPLWIQPTGLLSSYDGGQIQTANVVSNGVVSRGVSTWSPGAGKVCLNAGAIGVGAMNTGFAPLATAGVGLLGGNPGALNESVTGYIRRVQYWPRVLSNAEMQSVTS
jgi:hypothetical protein